MGLKHCAVDTEEEIIVIHSDDDAIDRDNEDTDLAKYVSTGDPECLVFKDGATPTEFVIHALSDKQEKRALTRAMSDPGVRDHGGATGVSLAHEAYYIGCSEVRNWDRPGDSHKPSKLALKGKVPREIGLHVLRISGMIDGANAEAATDLGK